ncbi:hypothetical protein LEMLEM_LOCUS4598, partial [Lemmus lemmus]
YFQEVHQRQQQRSHQKGQVGGGACDVRLIWFTPSQSRPALAPLPAFVIITI